MNDLERRTLLSAAGIGAIAAMSKAGPLNPPAGSVTGTGRTLDEVYNRIGTATGNARTGIGPSTTTVNITQPGSYVLLGNVAVTTGNGISIAASGVSLDLNGFSVTSTSIAGTGIAAGSVERLAIRNGSVSGFATGIAIGGSATGATLEDLTVVAARLTGINIFNSGISTGIVVRRCNVINTGYSTGAADSGVAITAIIAGGFSQLIEDCVVSGVIHNASGSQTRRGLWINVIDTTSTLINRCYFCAPEFTLGTGILVPAGGQGLYRNCTVLNFSTGYSGGTNGGGNV